jgi:hypothetical protein
MIQQVQQIGTTCESSPIIVITVAADELYLLAHDQALII